MNSGEKALIGLTLGALMLGAAIVYSMAWTQRPNADTTSAEYIPEECLRYFGYIEPVNWAGARDGRILYCHTNFLRHGRLAEWATASKCVDPQCEVVFNREACELQSGDTANHIITITKSGERHTTTSYIAGRLQTLRCEYGEDREVK